MFTAPCKPHPDNLPIHTYTKTAQIVYVSPPPETASPPRHPVSHIPTTFRYTRTQKHLKSCTCLYTVILYSHYNTLKDTCFKSPKTHVHKNRPNRVRVSSTRNRIPSTAPCKPHPDNLPIHTYTKTAQIVYVSPPSETASPPRHPVSHIPTTFRYTRTQKPPKSCTCLLQPKPHPHHGTL